MLTLTRSDTHIWPRDLQWTPWLSWTQYSYDLCSPFTEARLAPRLRPHLLTGPFPQPPGTLEEVIHAKLCSLIKG